MSPTTRSPLKEWRQSLRRSALLRRVEVLRADYAAVTGRPFDHFFCPFLFRDEPAELCRAHIINSAFARSSRKWTAQRTDVDCFFGAACESDLVMRQDLRRHEVVDVIADRNLSRRFRPTVVVGGRVVPHYLPHGGVPANHTSFTLDRPGKAPFTIVLERHRDEIFAGGGFGWEVSLATDGRAGAFGALLKAAHLTLFRLLGYRYALSPGGRFLGREVLGRFFEENRGAPRAFTAARAAAHFRPYAGMVRLIEMGASNLPGTITDGLAFTCWGDSSSWAFVVLVRTGELVHAVLVPTLDSVEHKARFDAFLADPDMPLELKAAKLGLFRWALTTDERTLDWKGGRVASWAGRSDGGRSSEAAAGPR